jgi:hypothetical protein
MSRLPLALAFTMAATALSLTGCGAGNRQLDSLSISPASATYNGAAVQFTATGHWSASPVSVTPQQATWGACTSNQAPTTDVTVSSTGVAACASGAKGTYEVYAWDPQYGSKGGVCNAVTACGGGCGRVSASVQLTCP